MAIWEIDSYVKSPSEISVYFKESLVGILCPRNDPVSSLLLRSLTSICLGCLCPSVLLSAELDMS